MIDGRTPGGVIEAVRLAQKQVDCTLVLVGNTAVDDPEAEVILEMIHSSADERIVVVSVEDALLVNALQRQAAVVLQKSIREGFGLTVTEAMWKGAAVIGGNVAGIRRQITDGENGFWSIPWSRRRSGSFGFCGSLSCAKELVQQREKRSANFLLSRLAEDWTDLLGSQIRPEIA